MLYRGTFEFTPEFKLWFGTNHKPKITGTDDGIWPRIRLIPWTVRFSDRPAEIETGARPKRPRDELMAALRAELDSQLVA